MDADRKAVLGSSDDESNSAPSSPPPGKVIPVTAAAQRAQRAATLPAPRNTAEGGGGESSGNVSPTAGGELAMSDDDSTPLHVRRSPGGGSPHAHRRGHFGGSGSKPSSTTNTLRRGSMGELVIVSTMDRGVRVSCCGDCGQLTWIWRWCVPLST
jgi:hypothetical protein